MKYRLLFIFLLSTTAIVMFLKPYSLISDFLQLQNQSLCACDKCLREDPLLPKSRFDTSIQPFLSANYKLSENAFNWWKVGCLMVLKDSLKVIQFKRSNSHIQILIQICKCAILLKEQIKRVKII